MLQLPNVLRVNLGKAAANVSCLSVLFPFVRTGMTNDYAENERVYGRWQPRMLETHECAEAFAQLLSRPREETDLGMFELLVDPADTDPTEGATTDPTDGEAAGQVPIRVTWKQVRLDVTEHELAWSEQDARTF